MNGIISKSLYLTIFIGIIFTDIQCQTKKQTMMNINIPKVTTEFEEFEWEERFDPNTTKVKFFLDDSTYIEIEKQSNGFIERRWNPESYFLIIKKFYENGFIKEKGVIFNSGYFYTGTWYHFNKAGELTDEKNHDLNYNFNFHDLFQMLQKKNIILTIGHIPMYTGFHPSISKQDDSGKPMWVVKWLREPQLAEKIFISGETGKVIKTVDIKINE